MGENGGPDLAPCGMDCVLCEVRQREKKPCGGCSADDGNKPRHCVACAIRHCDLRKQNAFCFACGNFPCSRLKQLDSRYQRKYGVSLIENLRTMKNKGTEAFREAQEERWRCKNCGAMLCIHKATCPECGSGRSVSGSNVK